MTVKSAVRLPGRHPRRACGFSLLEVLVAFSIMMLSLGVLYQAVGGSLRNLGAAERQTHAVLLAQSLLSLYDGIPPGGLSERGTAAGGFDWSLAAGPVADLVEDGGKEMWPLYRLEVEVAWQDRDRVRRYTLATLRPEVMEKGNRSR